MERFTTNEKIVSYNLRLPQSLYNKLMELRNKHRTSLHKEMMDGLEFYCRSQEEQAYYDTHGAGGEAGQ
jgi:hypothetical protein